MIPRSHFVALTLLLGVVACSTSHSLSHQELQSEFRASISLSSESEALLQHLEKHRYSGLFVHGHLSYLRKQGSEIEEELKGKAVDEQDASSFTLLRATTGELTKTLEELQTKDPNGPPDKKSRAHLHSIAKRLEDAMPR